MPKSVKAFVWLGVLYVLFGAALLAWYLIHTVPEHAQFLAQFPAATRTRMHNELVNGEIYYFLIHTGIFLMFASAAAWWRQNWARWMLVGYFLLILLMPVLKELPLYLAAPKLFLGIHRGLGGWWEDYLQTYWLYPQYNWPGYVSAAFKIALLVLIFSPNARPWFRAPPPE